MDQGANALLQAAREGQSLNELHDVDVDGSSSLSEIEDKDGDQEEDEEGSEELSNISDEENDSEAETERLEESPNKLRPEQDDVLSSHHDVPNYERTPSKLPKQITTEDTDDEVYDVVPFSDSELSRDESPESPKSSTHEDEPETDPPTAPTSLDDSSVENKNLLSTETDTRKRKRSIMAGSNLDDEEEPLRKRTGSILTPRDDYAIEDDAQPEEGIDISIPVNGNISGEEGGVVAEDEVAVDPEEQVAVEDEAPGPADPPISPRKRGRKKKGLENGVKNHAEEAEVAVEGEPLANGNEEVQHIEEENAEHEADDEAEAAQKNEEELEKKRIALEQLSSIERQFNTFRDRLFEDRFEQLSREEAMLRSSNPTHPEYLAMMRCIDTRRDEKLRIADTLREYQIESLKRSAVAKRSQILTQYQQEVREAREKKMELVGKQWYEIQHDRRSYAGSVPDYTLKFPARRSQQVMNQVAYSNEVSILSGIAKYVGFPAAPTMASATAAEMEEDLEKMGVRSLYQTLKQAQMQPASLPLQELAALRSAGSTSRFKPAEEQFIERTPWANPQHPSHAHLLQRQASAQQAIPRTMSPFSEAQAKQRRHSHQPRASVPTSGTFSNSPSLLQLSNGRTSSHNPLGNSNSSHTVVPSPLGSRQPSLSPEQSRPATITPDQPNIPKVADVPKNNGMKYFPPDEITDIPRDFPQGARREQVAAGMSRF
ncbi:Sds3-like-domain-containing protein [Amylocarpus encephaloides]|uniref:Sds3-like-domain-containing protein n=1 Tax=Amylocarpus encephaloides TaxID=45428 RepID=A0A9P7YJ05_9HELO|nr:Sds3-like-domain-containing protein [Amylocarpus encephaloides]